MSSNGHTGKREAILARVGLRATEPATMPGGPDGDAIDVLVRELTGKESKEFEIAVAKNNPHAFGMLIQMVVVDPETNELLFEPADRAALEGLGITALKPIAELSQKLSGITQADIDKAKELLLQAPPIG